MAYLPNKLLGVINTNPLESTNRQIAAYVLNNLEKIDYMSASSLAAACSVSKSSISRFCRELDYVDFYHFQLDAIRYTRNSFDKFSIESSDANETLTESYMNQLQRNVERLKTCLDDAQIQKIAEEIETHANVILLGNMQSGDIAYILQHNLFVAGKSATVAVNPKEQRALLQTIRPNTVVIIFSRSGTFFECLNMPHFLERRPENVKLYLITVQPIAQIPPVVDDVIRCDVGSSLAGGNLSMELVANLIVLHYHKTSIAALDAQN